MDELISIINAIYGTSHTCSSSCAGDGCCDYNSLVIAQDDLFEFVSFASFDEYGMEKTYYPWASDIFSSREAYFRNIDGTTSHHNYDGRNGKEAYALCIKSTADVDTPPAITCPTGSTGTYPNCTCTTGEYDESLNTCLTCEEVYGESKPYWNNGACTACPDGTAWNGFSCDGYTVCSEDFPSVVIEDVATKIPEEVHDLFNYLTITMFEESGDSAGANSISAPSQYAINILSLYGLNTDEYGFVSGGSPREFVSYSPETGAIYDDNAAYVDFAVGDDTASILAWYFPRTDSYTYTYENNSGVVLNIENSNTTITDSDGVEWLKVVHEVTENGVTNKYTKYVKTFKVDGVEYKTVKLLGVDDNVQAEHTVTAVLSYPVDYNGILSTEEIVVTADGKKAVKQEEVQVVDGVIQTDTYIQDIRYYEKNATEPSDTCKTREILGNCSLCTTCPAGYFTSGYLRCETCPAGKAWDGAQCVAQDARCTNGYTEISTPAQLAAINDSPETLAGCYKLVADIDLSAYGSDVINSTTGIKGWTPIGDYFAYVLTGTDEEKYIFTGVFDGNDHKITGLTLYGTDSCASIYGGLFGVIGETGKVKDLEVSAVFYGDEICGDGAVGALAGESHGTISNVSATLSHYGIANAGVCGLVYKNTGLIEDSQASYISSGMSDTSAGFVCENTGTIRNSSADATIARSYGDNYGGFVSDNSGTIENSYSAGDIAADGRVGGFAGKNSGTITASYSETNVFGYQYVGGFVGQNNGTISDAYANGSVSVDPFTENSYVGGFAGSNSKNIANSYSTGDIKRLIDPEMGDMGAPAGGFVGINSGTISSSYFDTTTGIIQDCTSGTCLARAQVTPCGDNTGTCSVVGKTTSELQVLKGSNGMYSDWASDIWGFSTSDYPKFL